MNKKYNEVMKLLLDEWFKSRSQLANYDFEMLKNLAHISLTQQPLKSNNTDEKVKDNKKEKI